MNRYADRRFLGEGGGLDDNSIWSRTRAINFSENGALVAQMFAELEEFLAGLPPEAVPLLLELLETEEDFDW